MGDANGRVYGKAGLKATTCRTSKKLISSTKIAK